MVYGIVLNSLTSTSKLVDPGYPTIFDNNKKVKMYDISNTTIKANRKAILKGRQDKHVWVMAHSIN